MPVEVRRLAEPCRNFNILAMITINDPRDGGREKLVLSNLSLGAVGSLILIDPETGEGETIPMPGDGGAWALLNIDNKKLLVGTCPHKGYLHALDLASRKWAEPLRDENETYIWNLTMGSDGCVYGGSFPGCVLFQYDPAHHRLRNLGSMSDNPKDQYLREVRGEIPGYIIVHGGYDRSFLAAWNVQTQERVLLAEATGSEPFKIKEITGTHLSVEHQGETIYYEPGTFRKIDAPSLLREEKKYDGPLQLKGFSHRSQLQNGNWAVVKGQEYAIGSEPEQTLAYRPIPVQPPATEILTLAADAEGNIWGSSSFGQTIFRYNPKIDSWWNSMVVCDAAGEVYGMQFVNGKLFMTAYNGGDHLVYDPAQPWDQRNNRNPRVLSSVGPELIRSMGRSVIGPDGAVWTGWSARYGVYGGGLSRIDGQTMEVQSWCDPVQGQQVCGMAADGKYIYFVTNPGANGLPDKREGCWFCASSADGTVLYRHQMDQGEAAGALLAIDGIVLVREGTDVRMFDPEKLMFVHRLPFAEPCCWMTVYEGHVAAAFCGTSLYWIDVRERTARKAADLPASTGTAVLAGGQLYWASGTVLYTLEEG